MVATKGAVASAVAIIGTAEPAITANIQSSFCTCVSGLSTTRCHPGWVLRIHVYSGCDEEYSKDEEEDGPDFTGANEGGHHCSGMVYE